MALHHRPELHNMRLAYCHSTQSQKSNSSSSAQSSRIGSERSYETQPTLYSSSPGKGSTRPARIHYNTCEYRAKDVGHRWFEEKELQGSPEASAESIEGYGTESIERHGIESGGAAAQLSMSSYASTVESDEEPEEVAQQPPDYGLPEYVAETCESSVIPATPSDFSHLFPSHRRLMIRHDDSTLDGNMNLRLDTEVLVHGRKRNMTLFHLRMHDLKNREFSFRRYCRDSGREVCHSERKQQKARLEKRPGFQRSLSNALSSMRPRSESRTMTLSDLKRHDSGYASTHSMDSNEDDRPRTAGAAEAAPPVPSNDTIRLDFSNYAQLDVKRSGVKPHKRYEFEYWGTHYAWRRSVRKDGTRREFSYHLTRAGSDRPLAHITPTPLSPHELAEEQHKGGWVQPSVIWLADDQLVRGAKDVVDAVIACGVMALVDDAIRSRFHARDARPRFHPLPKVGVEYVGPKRLIHEIFRRDT
ncbi:hypothetical protein M433DRAFT_6695 [Acidomyces richmondensis BFW]|nr:hypothetical protein M433DRAFT_6695 [Acidomyces richmondensis BFW]